MGPKKKDLSTPTDAKRRTTNRKWNPGIYSHFYININLFYDKPVALS